MRLCYRISISLKLTTNGYRSIIIHNKPSKLAIEIKRCVFFTFYRFSHKVYDLNEPFSNAVLIFKIFGYVYNIELSQKFVNGTYDL